MKRVVIIGFFMALVLCSLHLSAVIYNHGQTGVSIWLPDEWKITQVGNALYAQHPDGQAMAQYIGIQSRNLKQGRQNFQRFLEPQIRRVRILREGERFQQKNLAFYLIHAEGWIRGRAWELDIYLIDAPGDMGMLVQRHLRGSAHRKTPFTYILESIKPHDPDKDSRRRRR